MAQDGARDTEGHCRSFDRTVTRLIRGRARVAGANDGRVRWLEVVAFTLSLLKGLND